MTDDKILHSQRLMKAENIFQGECTGLWDDQCQAALTEFNCRCDLLAAELGRFDERSEVHIRSLRLVAQREARLFMGRLRDAGLERSGYTVKIICGTRTYPEQAALYAKGRSQPGRKVTKKQPGESYHNFGLAWDIGVFSHSGAYLTDKNLYKKVGQLGSVPSLTWGGGSWRFLFFRDFPHYQLEAASQTGIGRLRESFEQGTACPLSC
jgi:peptidoglycan L-alanyl-D-glutamate endopeptidase CwlK